MATRQWTVDEQAELHRLGRLCDRRRRETHDAELRMQDHHCNAKTDAAYYNAVQALVNAEAQYCSFEAGLNVG